MEPLPYKKYKIEFDGKKVFHQWDQIVSEQALDFSDEEIAAIEADWTATEAENKAAYIHNRTVRTALIAETEKHFEQIGLPTWKKSLHGKILGSHKEFKAALKAIESKCGYSFCSKPFPHEIMVMGEKYRSYKSPVTLTELIQQARRHRQKETERKQKANKDFALAATLASTYGVSIDDPEMYTKVVEADRTAWVKKNFPDDKIIGISCCSDCDEWTVGEHRCSCGNRRMSLIVEGSIGNWYAYGEAH